MLISVELFVTQIREEWVIYKKYTFDITKETSDPDDLVVEYAQKNIFKENVNQLNFVMHSTSWHYDHNGRITMTYMFYSDFIDVKIMSHKRILLKDLTIAKSSNPKKPRPNKITETNIVAHGIRHIGYLTQTEKKLIFANAIKPANYEILKQIVNNLAGEIG